MAATASDRLIQKVRPYRGDSLGISIADIARLPLTTDLINDIDECLRNDSVAELKWGLWFAQGILDSNPPKDLLWFLVANLPKWMGHDDLSVRESALPLLIRLRENIKDYRAMMFKCINDSSPDVRTKALAAYSTFLKKEDIPKLLRLQHDDFLSETSMNSPLVYAIRNQALAIIEHLSGQKFHKFESVESINGEHMAYWWDWKPFLEWWATKANK